MINTITKGAFYLFIGLFFIGCKSENKPVQQEATKITDDKESSEWTYLFDGTSTEGWRGYNAKTLPPNWVIQNGELTFDVNRKVDGEYEGGKDIIYAAEEFDNFELYLEWKIPPGGNSGILYHVKEGYQGPYDVAPEYQLIDDENYAKMHDLEGYNKSLGYENPKELHALQSTAADYAMYTCDDSKKILNPAGEWNSTKIVFTTDKVEHWLNDQKVLSFVPWSDDWNERKTNSKWRDFEDYGKFKKGFICLQDHDSPLWFRNIKIKRL